MNIDEAKVKNEFDDDDLDSNYEDFSLDLHDIIENADFSVDSIKHDPLSFVPDSVDLFQESRPRNTSESGVKALVHDGIVLKTCRVQLGYRIDDPFNFNPKTRLPTKCQYQGCTSKLRFKTRTQFNRHMKTHKGKDYMVNGTPSIIHFYF